MTNTVNDDADTGCRDQGKYPPLLLKLLEARGIYGTDAVAGFLGPSLDDLHDPFLLDGMDTAAARVVKALEDHEAICIYGDYDVDGITSVAMLYDFLDGHGADVTFHIPDRQRDGYGMSVDALEKIVSGKVDLVITVDCGTASVREAEYLKNTGVDLIVTDHHECSGILPSACAVLNPAIPGSSYPFRDLSGIGVAYKLISAVCDRLGEKGREHGYLDLAAVGTVADAVCMTGENRIIVSYGLKKLNSRPNPGLLHLIKKSGIQNRAIDEDTVGYVIAPRINAAGRLGDPSDAVELLLTDDDIKAEALACLLCDLNKERQYLQNVIVKEVDNMISEDLRYSCENVLVVSGAEWKSGIIGIVASVIAEKYRKPTLIVTFENDGQGKGSGRSTGGFNLFEALAYSSGLLCAFGGHEKAAGFTIKPENVEAFRSKINEFAVNIGIEEHKQEYTYDIVLNNENIDIGTITWIKMMAPFGEGNPKPVFAYTGLKISDVKPCGSEDKHLKLKLSNMGSHIDCIAYNLGQVNKDLVYGDKVDILGYLQINEWKNRKSVQIQVIDIKRGTQ
jgi:single-stranded-DNA-specific exonuclease